MQHRTLARVDFTILALTLALSLQLAGCTGTIEPLGGDDSSALAADGGVGSGSGSGSAVTWKAIGPLMVRASCTSCHGTQGTYSVETYSDALACGTDGTPNVIAGDASSALVAYTARQHGGMTTSDAAVVRTWVMGGARER